MLRGDTVNLRLVREADLEQLFIMMSDIETRGDYFPRGLASEPAFRSRFAETGFWGKDEGMLLIVEPDGEIVGEIEFFPITDGARQAVLLPACAGAFSQNSIVALWPPPPVLAPRPRPKRVTRSHSDLPP